MRSGLQTGARFGPYEVISAIGEGGMGEVWKAKDTRLKRTVAIKTVKGPFGERFEREAQAISALNHPHICTLYDVGSQDGSSYLVMEYLEGLPLKGPLSFDKVLEYGRQILDALDAAHQKGIVHRDLKPANILLTKNGVKLLDFGLAKIQPRKEAKPEMASTVGLTDQHTVLGTPHYMAPEQFEGKEADPRSDLWAFGCVLYELVTGQRAFEGKSPASVIGAIFGTEPPSMCLLQRLTPPAMERLVRICLAKDPEERWQTARDLRHALTSISLESAASAAPTARPWLWIAATMFLAVLSAALAGTHLFKHSSQTVDPMQLSILAPEKTEITSFGSGISPDGRFVVFTAASGCVPRLWLRQLASSSARLLEGTEDASYPFWSPDSRALAFFAKGKLKRIDVDGRSPQVLCNAQNGRGGDWSSASVIVFAPGVSARLLKVSAAGGKPEPATQFDAARKDSRHNWPQFLPDGRHFLLFVRSADPEKTGTYLGSLDDPTRLDPVAGLMANNFRAVFARVPGSSAGYLIYFRDRLALAQRFDSMRHRLEGFPVPVPVQQAFHSAAAPGFVDLSASNTGILLDGGSQRSRFQLVWRRMDGSIIEAVSPEDDYVCPRLSPDGTRVAVTRADKQSGEYDIWLFEFGTRTFRRFTFAKGLDIYPVWSPDGSEIVYSSDETSRPNLYRKLASGALASSRIAAADENQYGYDWSSDGRYIAYTRIAENERGDLFVIPSGGGKPFPYLETHNMEVHPQFSPEPGGPRWMAYTSDESGEEQVYLRRFTGGAAPDARWQVSEDGGSHPRWRGDGKELYFLSRDGKMMAATLRLAGDAVEINSPRALFDAKLPIVVYLRYAYDVSRDGQRFLVTNPLSESASSSLTIHLNWLSALQK